MSQFPFTKVRLFGLGILLLVSCTVKNGLQTEAPVVTIATPPLPTNHPTITNTSLATPFSTATDKPTVVAWITKDTWTPANQIRTMLIDNSGNLWTGAPDGLVYWDLKTGKSVVYALNIKSEKTNVVALVQTPDNAIWIGTYGNGITKFDGANWQSFTSRDGLPGDYVVSLIVTKEGALWLDTKKLEYDYESGQEFHFGQFKDNTWISGVGGGFSWIRPLPNGSIVGARVDTGIAKHDSIIGIYDGQQWRDLGLVNQSVTTVTVAPDGTIWVATPNNIFHYVSRTWHKVIPPWAGKDFASVSSIAVASDGTIWFGFSFGAGDFGNCGLRMDYAKEWGVYSYDGRTWAHFTTDNGLVDNKICSIALDSNGNVYFGSFDQGVSRFDGHDWKSYIVP